MKKFFKYMALVAVAIMTTTAFTACDDDDDETTTQSSSIATWSWTASDTISKSLREVFDYTTTVTLPDGTTKSHEAGYSESAAISNTLNAADIDYPAIIKVTTTRRLKEGYTPASDEKVSGKESHALSISGLDSNGLIVKGDKTVSRDDIDNLQVAKWANLYNGTTVSTSYITLTKTATGYDIEKPGYLTDF